MMDIDDAMNDINELEARDRGESPVAQLHKQDRSLDEIINGMEIGKVLVGTVEHYFDRIGVAAVKLVAPVKVGDVIEIRTGSGYKREVIQSMQIDKEEVDEAVAGAYVGIKLANAAAAGDRVYKLPER